MRQGRHKRTRCTTRIETRTCRMPPPRLSHLARRRMADMGRLQSTKGAGCHRGDHATHTKKRVGAALTAPRPLGARL